MHKIYAFNNGGSHGFMSAVAIGDDGHVLAGHCCSSVGFMPHDLGVTSDWKHEHYDKHFGKGNWEIEWVPCDKRDTHEGFRAALKLNETAPPPSDEVMPNVTVTTVDAEGKEHTHRVV